MQVVAEFVSSIALIIIAGALVHIGIGIKALQRTLTTKRLFSTRGHMDTLSFAPAGAPSHGFAVYMYRQGRWHLEADLSSPGCEVTPPEIEGTFDGQVVRKQAVPR